VAHCHACRDRYAKDFSETYTARKAAMTAFEKMSHFVVFFVPGDLDI